MSLPSCSPAESGTTFGGCTGAGNGSKTEAVAGACAKTSTGPKDNSAMITERNTSKLEHCQHMTFMNLWQIIREFSNMTYGVFSKYGARPSSAAAMLACPAISDNFRRLGNFQAAAPGDGRAPIRF
jgi:hypothetical protein